MTVVRIGAVSYLNARPLVQGLQSCSEYSLVLDTPSALSEKLRLGEIDVGLIPIVEYLRGVGEAIVPGICIASDGPVCTVKLFSRLLPEKLSDVAVDSGSRTSVALLRVLLAERYGITPDFHTFRPDLREMLRAYEGGLLIGDAAFTDSGAPHVWDLGQGWSELMNLPFVYAVWVLGKNVDGPKVAAWLTASKQAGMGRLDSIARDAAQALGHDETQLRRYLVERLHYSLGERQLRGIEAFQKLCARYNVVTSARSIRLLGEEPVEAQQTTPSSAR